MVSPGPLRDLYRGKETQYFHQKRGLNSFKERETPGEDLVKVFHPSTGPPESKKGEDLKRGGSRLLLANKRRMSPESSSGPWNTMWQKERRSES